MLNDRLKHNSNRSVRNIMNEYVCAFCVIISRFNMFGKTITEIDFLNVDPKNFFELSIYIYFDICYLKLI